MDNATLAARLRAMADLIETGPFAVSWMYVDPTPDGPHEARTVHTIELDGVSAAEVLGNLDALVSSFHTLETIAAHCSPGRVVFEAVGEVIRGQAREAVRGTAIILEPYATPLRNTLGLPYVGDEPATRYDLTLTQVEALAADPQMQAGVESPSGPDVTIPAPPPEEAPPSTTPTETPSDTTPDPASPTSQPTPSQPSAPEPAPAPEPQQQPEDSGVVVRGNSDTPAPSPDPTSTATTGPAPEPTPATGQQPGTEDNAPHNPDGTPVEPTAGRSADVGPDASSETPSAGDSGLPGQAPIEVSDEPLPADQAGGSSTPPGFDTIDPERQARIAALEAELAELRTPGAGGGEVAVTSADGEVTVAGNADDVPRGGSSPAAGQGGGPSGDPAGGGYGSAETGSDGY